MWKWEGRERRSEVRGQMADDRSQKTDDSRQKTEAIGRRFRRKKGGRGIQSWKPEK